jgi:hypothetical protein
MLSLAGVSNKDSEKTLWHETNRFTVKANRKALVWRRSGRDRGFKMKADTNEFEKQRISSLIYPKLKTLLRLKPSLLRTS